MRLYQANAWAYRHPDEIAPLVPLGLAAQLLAFFAMAFAYAKGYEGQGSAIGEGVRFGVVIAIFVGIGLVSKEIEKRTLYTVLSRPVRRWEFIVGKFFGLAGTLVVNAFFMAIGVFAALLYVAHKFQKPDGWVLVALYFIILQFLIICSLALLFSSFSSPLLSAVFAFSLFVIGTFSEDLRNFAGMATGLTKWLATAVAYLIPNFSALNVISSVAHGQPVSGQLIVYNTLYALLYATMALCGAILIFQRRNLK